MEIKNTYISYWKLISLLRPYLLVSWWEDFLSTWELDMLINLAIQDLLNNDTFSFMSTFELIDGDELLHQDTYKVFKTEHPINRINELYINKEWVSLVDKLVNTMPSLNSNEFYFKRGTNVIYWNQCIESIAINYEQDFELVEINVDTTLDKELPIPFTFVPALIKMIYDNMSMFTFFQWEWSTTDYYGHAKTRMNDLRTTDELSSEINLSIK